MEVDRRNVKKYLIENLSSILGVDKNTLDLDASFDDFGDEAEYKIKVLQFLETVYDFEIDEEQGADQYRATGDRVRGVKRRCVATIAV